MRVTPFWLFVYHNKRPPGMNDMTIRLQMTNHPSLWQINKAKWTAQLSAWQYSEMVMARIFDFSRCRRYRQCTSNDWHCRKTTATTAHNINTLLSNKLCEKSPDNNHAADTIWPLTKCVPFSQKLAFIPKSWQCEQREIKVQRKTVVGLTATIKASGKLNGKHHILCRVGCILLGFSTRFF